MKVADRDNEGHYGNQLMETAEPNTLDLLRQLADENAELRYALWMGYYGDCETAGELMQKTLQKYGLDSDDAYE